MIHGGMLSSGNAFIIQGNGRFGCLKQLSSGNVLLPASIQLLLAHHKFQQLLFALESSFGFLPSSVLDGTTYKPSLTLEICLSLREMAPFKL